MHGSSIAADTIKEIKVELDISKVNITDSVKGFEFFSETIEKIRTVIETSSVMHLFKYFLNHSELFDTKLYKWNLLDKPKYHFLFFLLLFIFVSTYMMRMIKKMNYKIEQLYEDAKLDITSFETNNLQNLFYLENLSKQQILQMESEFLILREQLMTNCLEVTKSLTYLQNDFIQIKDLYNHNGHISSNYEINVVDNGKCKKEIANHFLEDLISVSSSREDDDPMHIMDQNEQNSNNSLASSTTLNKKNELNSLLDIQSDDVIDFNKTEELEVLKFLDKPFQNQHCIDKIHQLENQNESIILDKYIKAKAFSDRKQKCQRNSLDRFTTQNFCFQPESDIIGYIKNNLTASDFFTNMYGIEYDFELTNNLEDIIVCEDMKENYEVLEGKEDSENFKLRFFILNHFHGNYITGSIDLDQLETFSEKKILENIIKISKSERTILFQIAILVLGDLAIFNSDREDVFQLIIEGLLDLLEFAKLNDNKFLKRFYLLNFFKFINNIEYSTKLTEVVTHFHPSKNKLKYYTNVLDIMIFIVFQFNNLEDKEKDRSLFIEFFRSNEFVEMYNKSSEIKNITSNIYVGLKLITWDDECCRVMFNELFDHRTKTKIENYYNSNISC